jgi:hypothetical protein
MSANGKPGDYRNKEMKSVKKKFYTLLSFSTSGLETIVKPAVKYLEILTLEGNELIFSN